MNDKFVRWERDLQEVNVSVQQLLGNLTLAQLNWKPDASIWSISEIIGHLIAVNQSYFPIIDQIKAGVYRQPLLGNFSFLTAFFGKALKNALNPSNENKTRTLKLWQPKTVPSDQAILADFMDHQENLIRYMHESRKFVSEGRIIASPANSMIVYTLEDAFEIIVLHEQRHMKQIKERLEQILKREIVS